MLSLSSSSLPPPPHSSSPPPLPPPPCFLRSIPSLFQPEVMKDWREMGNETRGGRLCLSQILFDLRASSFRLWGSLGHFFIDDLMSLHRADQTIVWSYSLEPWKV